jgi:hypothetical protein
MGFIPYGQKWRDVRKAFHAYFHLEAAKKYEPLEMLSVHSLLRNLLETPGDFLQHTRQ